MMSQIFFIDDSVVHRICLFLMLFTVSPLLFASPQDDYETGIAALQSSDMGQAISLLSKAGNEGHVKAMEMLAFIYNGAEFPDESAKWDLKAANSGSSIAAFRMYGNYKSGRGVDKDEKEAVKWLNAAAERGYPEAMMTLVTAYEEGQMGYKVDNKKALSYLANAAKIKHVNALLVLADAYSNGRFGLTPDPNKAAIWRKKAEEIKAESTAEAIEKTRETGK